MSVTLSSLSHTVGKTSNFSINLICCQWVALDLYITIYLEEEGGLTQTQLTEIPELACFIFLKQTLSISLSLRKSFPKIMTLFFSASLSTIWTDESVEEWGGTVTESQETQLCLHGAVWPWVSLSHSLGLRFPVWMTGTWRSSPASIFSGSTNIWNSHDGTPGKEGYLGLRVSWSPGIQEYKLDAFRNH